MNVLSGYLYLLENCKECYASQIQEDTLGGHFGKACHKPSYVEYPNDLLFMSNTEEWLKIVGGVFERRYDYRNEKTARQTEKGETPHVGEQEIA